MDDIKLCGIYKLQSSFRPERIYIGSSIDIGRRWNHHLVDLRRNKHHAVKLQRHFNKYGEDDLLLSVIQLCDNEVVREREQCFLTLYNPYFNSGHIINGNYQKIPWNKGVKGMQVCWKKGLKMPEEQRLRMIGKKRPRDVVEKIRLKRLGHKQSKEWVEKRAKSDISR